MENTTTAWCPRCCQDVEVDDDHYVPHSRKAGNRCQASMQPVKAEGPRGTGDPSA